MLKSDEDIIKKIDLFIRKYYLSRMIRGVLFGLAVGIVSYLVVTLLEYLSWFDSPTRRILFFIAAAVTSFIVISFFLYPIFCLIYCHRLMSRDKAAAIIGRFFPEISDRLLNTLQLNAQLEKSSDDELLKAAIKQKSDSLRIFKFSDAVDSRVNRRVAIATFIASATLLILFFTLPEMSIQPAQRIMNYDQHFIRPLPFQVILSDTAINTTQNATFEFSICLKGENLPQHFHITTQGTRFMMHRDDNTHFSFVFKNILQNQMFQVEGGDYVSQPIPITVNPTPILRSYEALIAYPHYINRKDDRFVTKQRLILPQGSQITLIFNTLDVDSLFINDGENRFEAQRESDIFTWKIKALTSMKLNVSYKNKFVFEENALPFVVDVIPDKKPEIRVQEYHSDFSKQYFYSGIMADDYGFSKLLAHFDYDDEKKSFVKNLSFEKNNTRSAFYYSVDLDTLKMLENDNVSLYFEIFDNDGVNGAKSARSETFLLALTPESALDSVADRKAEEFLASLEKQSTVIDELQKKIEDILKDLLSKKELDWSDKEKMKELLENQKLLNEEWEKLREEQKDLSEFLENNELLSEELKDKLEELNSLFEEKEMSEAEKIMEELKEKVDELTREEMQDIVKDLRLNNEQLQRMMNRNLNLFEQFKVEKDINSLANDLNKLAEELQKSGEEGVEKSAEEALEEFKKMEERLDSIMKSNEKLSHPFNIDKDEQLTESIENDLNEASSQERSSDSAGSNSNKQQAGKKMEQMAADLMSGMDMGMMEQMAEDAALIRILLENVVRASLEQEALSTEVGRMKKDDPTVSEKISKQKNISDNFVMVADSLRAIGERQSSVQEFVFNELHDIKQYISNSIESLQNQRFLQASSHEQHAMTSMNNLALMLAESLNDMNNMMMSMGGSGQKSCSNPQNGEGEENMEKMMESQKVMGEKLKNMQKEMKKGEEGNPALSSEQFARMAAEQEMIRRKMEQMLEELKRQGRLGNQDLQKIIEDMKLNEEDLVNKRITRRTIERNKQIESRMLKAKNAEEQREKDEKRKSNEFKGSYPSMNPDELEYDKAKRKMQDFLRNKDIEFQPFYQEKINDYFLRKNTFNDD